MKKITKIQGGKTNNLVNIPTAWLEILRAVKGDEVQIELDVKKNQIVVKFEKK